MRAGKVAALVLLLLLLILAGRLVDVPLAPEPEPDSAAEDMRNSRVPDLVAEGSSPSAKTAIQCLEFDGEHGPLVATVEEQREIAAVLAWSDSVEHRLIAVLMSTIGRPDEQTRRLVELHRKFPDEPLVIARLLDACGPGHTDASCDSLDMEKVAMRKLGDNGAVWARIAVARHYRGDMSGAMEALERANAAPEFNDYVTDAILSFDRSLAAAGNLDRAGRFETALALVYGQGREVVTAFDICLENIHSFADWHSACMDYGRRMERDSSTIDSMGHGLALQRFVLGDNARDAEVEDLERRQAELLEHQFEFSDNWTAQQVYGQPVILDEYMAQLETGGEIAARTFLADAARRIREACR